MAERRVVHQFLGWHCLWQLPENWREAEYLTFESSKPTPWQRGLIFAKDFSLIEEEISSSEASTIRRFAATDRLDDPWDYNGNWARRLAVDFWGPLWDDPFFRFFGDVVEPINLSEDGISIVKTTYDFAIERLSPEHSFWATGYAASFPIGFLFEYLDSILGEGYPLAPRLLINPGIQDDFVSGIVCGSGKGFWQSVEDSWEKLGHVPDLTGPVISPEGIPEALYRFAEGETLPSNFEHLVSSKGIEDLGLMDLFSGESEEGAYLGPNLETLYPWDPEH